MKKFLIVMLLALCSCSQRFYPWGMSIQQFLTENHDAVFVQGNSHQSVYRRMLYPLGAPAVAKYFYFTDGKLTQIDEGVRQPDITIQNNN